MKIYFADLLSNIEVREKNPKNLLVSYYDVSIRNKKQTLSNIAKVERDGTVFRKRKR